MVSDFRSRLRQTMQFAGSHLLSSLLSFNIGVELGQLLVLALMIPALELLFRYVVAERMGTIILSALVAHTAWHWMIDRYAVLSQYPIRWPAHGRGAAGKGPAPGDVDRHRGGPGLGIIRFDLAEIRAHGGRARGAHADIVGPRVFFPGRPQRLGGLSMHAIVRMPVLTGLSRLLRSA